MTCNCDRFREVTFERTHNLVTSLCWIKYCRSIRGLMKYSAGCSVQYSSLNVKFRWWLNCLFFMFALLCVQCYGFWKIIKDPNLAPPLQLFRILIWSRIGVPLPYIIWPHKEFDHQAVLGKPWHFLFLVRIRIRTSDSLIRIRIKLRTRLLSSVALRMQKFFLYFFLNLPTGTLSSVLKF
jgi:hypothetical protein